MSFCSPISIREIPGIFKAGLVQISFQCKNSVLRAISPSPRSHKQLLLEILSQEIKPQFFSLMVLFTTCDNNLRALFIFFFIAEALPRSENMLGVLNIPKRQNKKMLWNISTTHWNRL